MENVVDQLLEIDRRARRAIDDAQQYYDGAMEEIQVQKGRIAEEYVRRAQAHLGELRSAEEVARRDALEEIRTRFGALEERLEAAFRRQRDEWEGELLRRVLGESVPQPEQRTK